jgi:hypothetical protein
MKKNKGVKMSRRILAILMCAVLVFTMAGCGDSKKEKEEAEKAKQEEEQRLNEAAANAFVSAVESLPEKIKLKDETAVAGARALYDELTDEQKALVPSEFLTRLEEAEKEIEEHRAIKEKRDAEKAANKEAAAKAEDVLNGIPADVTLDAETAVNQARAEYNQLTDDQKKYVSKSAVDKLTSAEAKIKELKEEQKKKEEEKAKKKAAKKKAAEKKKAEEAKKKEKKEDKYAIAKKYVGKKASALISAIGKPKRKKKNPNCATDGEEYIYYYDGFYVGVLSQDMDSPLIVQNVTKN